MQAEHIPVHLGSMPDAVAAILGEEQRPGDGWILNDPFRGGTHLPDITLIPPVFDRDEATCERLLGFAASRAHHADVGGPTPGGMPADSTTLDEEGVVIPPTRPTTGSRSSPNEMRNPSQRLADLRAQQAANLVGRAAPARARRAARPRRACATGWRRSSTTPSAAPAPRWRSSPTAPGRPSDVLEDGPDGARGRRAAGARRRSRASSSSSTSPAAPTRSSGNLNCPLSVTKLGLVLRRAGADRSRRAALGGRPPAGRGEGAARDHC